MNYYLKSLINENHLTLNSITSIMASSLILIANQKFLDWILEI